MKKVLDKSKAFDKVTFASPHLLFKEQPAIFMRNNLQYLSQKNN